MSMGCSCGHEMYAHRFDGRGECVRITCLCAGFDGPGRREATVTVYLTGRQLEVARRLVADLQDALEQIGAGSL